MATCEMGMGPFEWLIVASIPNDYTNMLDWSRTCSACYTGARATPGTWSAPATAGRNPMGTAH